MRNVPIDSERDLDNIVMGFAVLGLNLNDRSFFLGASQRADEIILNFLKQYDIPTDLFCHLGNMLMFTNAYNALRVFLDLQDKALEKEILSRLRDPNFYIRISDLEKRMPKPKYDILKEIIGSFFISLIDDINIEEGPAYLVSSPEKITERFLDFLTNGKYKRYVDLQAWFVFYMTILSNLSSFPEAIYKVKKQLSLK